MVDEEEKVLNNVYTLGGNQQAWFLTENGIYEVLMLSRKPIAKQWKKEVELPEEGSFFVRSLGCIR
ncbi:BRO family protein [Bacillus toyonensis]|uniref:BRO family protein n=1 Tax=Bacillus toyonensis TaxID=155322 RepID=UPI002E1EC22D|nr:BRO family protein [Bacillus toyonensis]